MPGQAETIFLSPGHGDDEKLFSRGVPQVADWLRCWRACQTPASFSAAEENGVTENFIQGSRQKRKASRKAFAAMVRVMGLTMRARKLRLLKKASSIAIGLDDRGPYRLTIFRFNTEPGEHAGMFPAKGLAELGVGVFWVLCGAAARLPRRLWKT